MVEPCLRGCCAFLFLLLLDKRFTYKMLPHPSIRQSLKELDTSGLSQVSFGKEMLQEFGFDKNVSQFNHGSFGAVPNRVLELQHEYNREREQHPDVWYRINGIAYMKRTRMEVASRINANVDNVVMMENTTTALNCSLKSYPFKAGDGILYTNTTYLSMKNLCQDFTTRLRPDVEAVMLDIKLPIESEDDVIDAYEEILEKHPNLKVAIIDHITSPTSILMPIARLTSVCHSYGVVVLVDGAQAFGQIPLDMHEIGADVYTSNIHKWSYSPRGANFLWFSDECRDWIQPPNTSMLWPRPLEDLFQDQGTRDNVPGICARHGIQFYDAVGGMDKIVTHTSQLAEEGKRLLGELGLESIQVPPSMEAPSMKLFRLPPLAKYPFSSENLWRLHSDMFAGSRVFGMVMSHEGNFYLRLCTQIFHDRDDLLALRDTVKAFLDRNPLQS